ncbi:MAG: MurR/RpiR family transcriptional regulator [Pseudomonadota bacterium]
MSDNPLTVADRIQTGMEDLTRAERQLAHAILDNYPVSGLGPLADLATAAEVSGPTVARMVQKLGFSGYAAFQAQLREELRAQGRTPVARHAAWADNAPSGHILNRFTEAVTDGIRASLAQIDPAAFDAACAMIADPANRVAIVGGRITHTMAEYLFLHLQVVRAGVTQVQTTSNTWPHSLLDAGARDVFVIFDMRRYETNTLRLAQIAHEQGARIVLITDQWRSPVHGLADLTFGLRTTAPSAWDSAVPTLLLIETMIAAIQDVAWDTTRDRMERLERMFDRTGLFRKFV